MKRFSRLPGSVRSGLLAASVAIVLLFAVLVLLSMRAERSALAGMETHHRVIEMSERAISRMAEAEMAQRDFLLTGDSLHALQYGSAVRQLEADLRAMRHAGADLDDSVAARRLERTIETRLERLELSMDLRRRVGLPSATRAVDPASGTTEIDGLRALARARVAAEEAELAAQAAVLRNRSTIVLWILFAGSALAVLIAAGIAALLQHASEELRNSEERLRALVEHTTDLISIVDARGRILYETPSAAAITGHPAQDRVGEDFFEHVHPEDRPEAQAAFRRLLESASAMRLSPQVRVRHRDGGWRWLEVRGQNLLAHPAIGGVVLTGHDITESRLLEEQFRQAQKLEAVGRMASGIAHDFNNLITTMQGYLSLALEALPAGSPARADLDEVQHATEHAALLTRQLLAFSRREVVQPKVIDPNPVAAETMRLLQRLLGEDVRVETALHAGLWPVRADRTQLQQVMMNLVVNARDAMPGGGTLRIETRNVTIRGGAGPAPVPDGAWVLLAIEDTGEGMDAKTREKIFEPFFTTKEVGKGTGLGLSTVYGIVARHGGHVHVESEPGMGTRFEIYLPRAAAEPAEADAGGNALAASGGGAGTILIVEDEAPVRRLARRLLARSGYTVLEAENGRDALHVCRTHPGRIDLILTDVVLPQMSGREVVRAVSERYPDVRVIFTSGYGGDILSERAGLTGEEPFVEKPFTSEQLLAAVRRALAPAARFPARNGGRDARRRHTA